MEAVNAQKRQNNITTKKQYEKSNEISDDDGDSPHIRISDNIVQR